MFTSFVVLCTEIYSIIHNSSSSNNNSNFLEKDNSFISTGKTNACYKVCYKVFSPCPLLHPLKSSIVSMLTVSITDRIGERPIFSLFSDDD